MNTHTQFDAAAAYWSASVLQDNLVICLNVVGALLLGIVVGYERTWNGRAAGMRTYGFVCMSAAALTVVIGHPGSWYGGQIAEGGGDPTRVIQGIVTGVGFLGAGVIMREGFNITGLATTPSIWTASVIKIIVGLGRPDRCGRLTGGRRNRALGRRQPYRPGPHAGGHCPDPRGYTA